MHKRMVGVALAAFLVLSGGNMAGGGEPVYGGTLEVSPETVEAGGVVTVSNSEGSECTGAVVTGNAEFRPGQWSTIPDENGDWSVDLGVPENGPPTASGEPTPFPEGEYDIFAFCEATCPEGFVPSQCAAEPTAGAAAHGVDAAAARGLDPPESFDYEPAPVTVVAAGEDPDPETPTTDPADPDDTTPTTAGGAVRPSDAAAPVAAQPTFTG